MSESFIQVTEGSGKKLHADQKVIGANTIQDEYVLLGENFLSSYGLASTAVTPTALGHILQIMAGATNKVRIRRIEIHQTIAATAAAIMEVAIIRLTTAGTGGVVQATSGLDPADGGSGATGMVLPTVKGTEGAVIWFGGAYLIQTVGASTPFANPLLVIDFDRPRSKPLIIAAGVANGICLRTTGAHAGASLRINVVFDESSF